MALRHIPHPVQNLRELLDNSHYKIIFEPDTAYLTTIKNVPSGEIKELNDLSTSGRFVYLRTRDFPSYSYLIRNGDHVQIFDTVTAMGFMAQGFSESGRCDFYWAKQAFLPFMYGMIGQKYSPLTPAINARLSRLFEAGLYNYWLSNQVPNITACVNTPTKVTMKEAIGINNIWGVAVIWTAGILLAGAVFGLEILHAKLRANSAF
ncbi:hypothetical protein SK128_006015 [Halocaridina rubra]|uniref:Uncharacterized protein n=1 Tax=Halocaridina rubra TaxID=373956 RepID=A0AAN8WV21_HALRR